MQEQGFIKKDWAHFRNKIAEVIADRAYKWFFKGDFSAKGRIEEDIVEIDGIDLENIEE